MAVLGKRKAPAPSVSAEEAHEIFRRHFEAQFAPLAESKAKRPAPPPDEDEEDDEDDEEGESEDMNPGDDDDEESEWGGLSDDHVSEEEPEPETHVVEVVDHSVSLPATKTASMSKRELKAFMSSRPPDQTVEPKEPDPSTTKPAKVLPEDAPSLLAQDLELRRLLAESHLLASPTLTSGVEPQAFASGRTRRAATDLRVQALGSKTSILKQEKMPMQMRKGMLAAASGRESKRRREAKENGVILERETPAVGKRSKRPRGGDVDRPGVGRLKGAQLRISERDVHSIEGGRDTFGRRGR